MEMGGSKTVAASGSGGVDVAVAGGEGRCIGGWFWCAKFAGPTKMNFAEVLSACERLEAVYF